MLLSSYPYVQFFFEKVASNIYLMDTKAGVDACTIDLFPLDIEPPDRRAHPFGANCNHADIFGEVKSEGLQVA